MPKISKRKLIDLVSGLVINTNITPYLYQEQGNLHLKHTDTYDVLQLLKLIQDHNLEVYKLLQLLRNEK